MATNQGFLNFQCGPGIRPLYLAYWFRANKPYLDLIANGSTYPELYKGDLFEFHIAVPSLEEQDARRQDTHARVNCPQLQDRVQAYASAVEQTLADMAQLPPDQRQRPLLSTTDLPHLPTVFRAIRDYQSTVATVQAIYGPLPPCHLPHKEIAYVALPTTGGHMLLRHLPVYGPLRGETIWQILE